MTPKEWMDLEDFSMDNPCPACEGADFACKYFTFDIVHPTTKKVINAGWIQKTCARCNYSWCEKPLHLASLGA
jgi:hypothetical protein